MGNWFEESTLKENSDSGKGAKADLFRSVSMVAPQIFASFCVDYVFVSWFKKLDCVHVITVSFHFAAIPHRTCSILVSSCSRLLHLSDFLFQDQQPLKLL